VWAAAAAGPGLRPAGLRIVHRKSLALIDLRDVCGLDNTVLAFIQSVLALMDHTVWP
jgi:hypothetical protein